MREGGCPRQGRMSTLRRMSSYVITSLLNVELRNYVISRQIVI